MSQHVAVIATVDVDHFLTLDVRGAKEIEVDAEWLLTNFSKHILMLAQLAIDSFAFHNGAGVILNVIANGRQTFLGNLDRRLQWMQLIRSSNGIGGTNIALGNVAVGD